MTVTVVIPARYASSRFPAKPLVPLRGATGEARSLIRRTWDAGRAVEGADRLVIATDDARIADEAKGFGAEVAMTSPDCANGTERCAEAVAAATPAPEIIVNLQGDAPLTPPWFIEALIAAMRADPAIAVATPVLRADARALESFKADRQAGRVGATTAVFDAAGRALYFSKEVLPFTGRALDPGETCPVFHHVGVYAYRPRALARYPALAPGPLEAWEGLEQLRFLEHGIAVHCVEVDARGAHFWELNNPEDVARVEAVLAERALP
ncbi:MAG TPA: manno-octulosonate cytidylyltransferase [Thermohalobaculum sp.]|nr:manno-octulosonate cytidylyltransferase [Thermohalobaculum sp.]